MTTNNEFFQSLRTIHQQSQRVPIPDIAALKSIVRVPDATGTMVDDTPEIEERALGTQNYLCVPFQLLLNGDFTGGLTSWTESAEAGIAGTTGGESGNGNTFSIQASMESLKVEMTDGDTATNVIERYQDIAAVAAEVWNVEAYAYVTALSGARAVLRIDFLDAALASLVNASATITAVNSAFAQMKLENQVAPASTAWIRVRLQLEAVTTPNATGLVYFDVSRAEKGLTTISDQARRIICGEWVCRN